MYFHCQAWMSHAWLNELNSAQCTDESCAEHLKLINLQEQAQDQGPAVGASRGRAFHIGQDVGMAGGALDTRRIAANGHHIRCGCRLDDHMGWSGLVGLRWRVSLAHVALIIPIKCSLFNGFPYTAAYIGASVEPTVRFHSQISCRVILQGAAITDKNIEWEKDSERGRWRERENTENNRGLFTIYC